MTRLRTAVCAVVLLFCASIIVSGCMSAQAAATQSAAPAARAVRPAAARTCVPRKIDYADAPYRVDNDIFTGMHGLSCLTIRGSSFTIDRNYAPQRGIVVAYPRIDFGPWYTSADPTSGLPVRVTGMSRMVAHVASAGRSGGRWQSDIDAWFYPSANTNRHGTFEMVIVNRSTPAYHPAAPAWIRQRVGHAWWWFHWPWTTCLRNSSGGCTATTWPILVITRASSAPAAAIRLSTFVYHARRLGFMHAMWLGNFAYGTECWSGCKGLTDSLTITGLLPVIHAPGGTP